ncbi:MAG: ferredoxin [Candidatus Gracilibacteria bacterium]|nr:ferredoxin [Candidatus Gracilibacteria bacterium]
MNKFNKGVIFLLTIWLLASCSSSDTGDTNTGTSDGLNSTQNEQSFDSESVDDNSVSIDTVSEDSSDDTSSIATDTTIDSGGNDFNVSSKDNSSVSISSNTNTDEIKKIDVDTGKKLTISSKCIGCGHCVRFSSTNFSFDKASHNAIVISQDNLDSSGVQQAIDKCPAQAISIS